MSTKKTKKIVEASTTTENKPNNNKKIFAPLGKYAVVAMIIASIIITTAIMLNKQLDTVEEQLAVMESEVAERNAATSPNTITTEVSGATIATQNTAEVTEAEKVSVEAQAVEVQAVEVAATEVQVVEVQATEVQAAEVLVATENTAKEIVSESDTEQASSTNVAVIEPAMNKNSAKDSQVRFAMSKRNMEQQARIESFKFEQKQHMTEMFARIKLLESKQLDQYKMHQEKQIQRLRQQLAKQELLIEELILRNKERVDFRAASMQRSQSNREKVLNRI
ncbi:MAG: hypothetical protein ACNYZG_06275 [Gammaproteobacteria bacterium]